MPEVPVLDVVLHPIRWQIVQRLLGRELTANELHRDLSNIPATTLYRHIATMIDAGFIQILRERKVRGTTERTLGLDPEKFGIDNAQAKSMSVEQHRQAFLVLLGQLATNFDRLVASDQFNDRIDQLTYSQGLIHIKPEDTAELRAEIDQVLQRYATESPATQPVMLSIFSIPDPG